ncbi:MAG: hypothetical protein DRI40_04980 [Chloroflexi bacterium]|nr:MAG: hypothetical protein DRI40_04980 [Chloroflexota bacterium]
MIRSFLPTDLLAILLQDGSLSDMARTWDGMCRTRSRLLTLSGLLVLSLNPRDRRRTWVWANGFGFRGLASVRKRCMDTSWEIDHLILREQDTACCSSLLERLSLTGGENDVNRIFLRLPSDSCLIAAADEAGFSCYMREYLCWLQNNRQPASAPAANSDSIPFPRRKRPVDDYRVFELYEKCLPVSVRRVTGMTFSEWQANKERGMKAEWVFDGEEGLAGWLGIRSSGRVGQFEVMADSDERLRRVVDYGLMFLGNCQQLFCLASETNSALVQVLEQRGFSRVGMYAALAKEPMAKQKALCLMPASA